MDRALDAINELTPVVRALRQQYDPAYEVGKLADGVLEDIRRLLSSSDRRAPPDD